MTSAALLSLVHLGEYAFLPPLCLAVALVTAAAHREDMRVILRHALRAWIMTLGGIALFTVVVSILVKWILP